MDLQKIKALIDLLADSPLAKLEVIEGEERVKLVKAKRRGKRAEAPSGDERVAVASTPGTQRSQGAQSPLAEPAQSVDAPNAAPATASEPQLVRAPMFGVVHLTPAPGEAPFVNTGDTIKEGQVLCTIEAMKMFNAIESELSGAVLEILVAPGSEVESGQPLFRIG
ncbi:Biotin carboxyl carrier protein of acetyl-CoA carboxylase [Paraburkholderia aspalathi]|uniref:Biotin carboxyl carrier protein of acetyl-CoA carboxylase n=1 Tax=Paraburkholderia aspalathi TaxID=1324617 RepID=A0ABM8RQC8_9BURK|nr:acetyl-CoA carboxylase biotin carboxyl carrier protein [Paraburkholderia aspalathi]MBK3819904.1 acetyl-CoA carboxylase biotin carboxyl carrier protein [Paraburkholderia aspalathi]MBK3831806.1 acetyl-CoA carboxylase biotin carboxyl carrier protein [Paraburkholderia aspalathi]MBK3861463.1 acetyl-CoA carboxylase biotin carboxyl carrier protein [Paraburkholderia aspalathi]CAE6765779.1 Biotin carboxyl carrier protein of acetyl-CoA carboxylase [Paraburkholderia aspalathi]